MIIVLRGKVVQHYYNDAGEKTASYELAPNSAQVGTSVPVGQWHALESLEEGSVIFECKDGAYQPLSAEDILEVVPKGRLFNHLTLADPPKGLTHR